MDVCAVAHKLLAVVSVDCLRVCLRGNIELLH